jgi:Tfp pilus assembly protein PilN
MVETTQSTTGNLLVDEYKASLSDLSHALMVAQANFKIAAERIAMLEKELGAARARIAELEAPVEMDRGVKIDEQGFPYRPTENAAAEGAEAA